MCARGRRPEYQIPAGGRCGCIRAAGVAACWGAKERAREMLKISSFRALAGRPGRLSRGRREREACGPGSAVPLLLNANKRAGEKVLCSRHSWMDGGGFFNEEVGVKRKSKSAGRRATRRQENRLAPTGPRL